MTEIRVMYIFFFCKIGRFIFELVEWTFRVNVSNEGSRTNQSEM